MSPFVFYLIILTAINDHYHELFHWGLQNVHNLILLFLLHLLVGILKRTFSFQLLSYSEIISTQSHIKRLNYFCLFTSIQNELVPSILQSWPESLFSIVMDFNILICFNPLQSFAQIAPSLSVQASSSWLLFLFWHNANTFDSFLALWQNKIFRLIWDIFFPSYGINIFSNSS